MKQKDIPLLLVVSFIAATFSIIFSNLLFTSPKNRQQEVEVVEKITSEFQMPDAKYFNPESVNPTVLIEIGENPKPQQAQPFRD